MEVQILEFTYEKVNVEDIEEQVNNYLNHHTIEDIKVTQWESQLLIFLFIDD